MSYYYKINDQTELRLIERQQAEELFRLIETNRDYLRRWHPWVDGILSVPDVDRMITTWKHQDASNNGFYAGIWFEGRLCGVINHVLLDWGNRWTALGYWLDEAHQHRGLMTMAVRILIQHSFEKWKLERVVIECAMENESSRAIPERLGFKLDGVIRRCEWLHDHFVDHAFYSLLSSEWQPEPENTAGEKEVMTQGDQGAAKIQPMNSHELTGKLAFEMHNAGRAEEAETLCRILLQVQPKDPQMLFLLGMVLYKSGRNEEAIRQLFEAAQLQPQSARIFNGLGCAHQNLKNYAQAVKAFERALELEPQSAATCYNLGNNCYQLGEIERAVAMFRRAVGIDPQDLASWNNLGKCLKEQNYLEESIAAYERAVAIAPDYLPARHGRAFSLLAAGRLVEGFREYELRWRSLPSRNLAGTAWKGERLPGETLLLHAEHGFGDAIQMVRFVAAARERVGRVILECRPELKRLFEYSQCADVMVSAGEPLPAYDYFISLISLPYVLGTVVETIPGQTPYLKVPPGNQVLPDTPGKLKVGLVWAGDPGHHQDAARSIPLRDFAPILEVPDAIFYCLQHHVPERDASYLQSISGTLNASPSLTDFLQTAAVIGELDLVITVDTAVAHLAGALGKPVWTLLQFSPDWRWFLKSTNSPWYSTMCLHRQTERGNWAVPIQRMVEDLWRLVELKKSGQK